ncbi:hypothetical protein J2S06_001327 [Bacillus alveayuensis]|uniref:Uncharacterized protein n=1 Tax=Aeribacillus alveayuensis TaxID=279215 RepID=A0ABT9VMR2_9BACI|nr:hypothetical protein [Bacillus alveayuensis]
MDITNKFYFLTAAIIFFVNGTCLGYILFMESFGPVYGVVMYYFLSLFGLFCLSILEPPFENMFYVKFIYFGMILTFSLPTYYKFVSVFIIPKFI